MIRVGVALERSTGGGNAARAVFSLPGARRVPGARSAAGCCRCRSGRSRSTGTSCTGTHRNADSVRIINQWRLGEALAGELDGPPIKALFVYNSNPAVVTSAQEGVLDGLARDDLFTVVSDHFVTDTARFADIVLPATMAMEQNDLMFSWGHLYRTYNPKVIEPDRRGGPEQRAVPPPRPAHGASTTRGSSSTTTSSSSGRSTGRAPQMDGHHARPAAGRGLRPARPCPDRTTTHPTRRRQFPTPSGKVELAASMAAGGNFVAPAVPPGRAGQPGRRTRRRAADVPAAPELGADPRYPLALVCPKPHAFMNSQYGNMAKQLHQQGEQWCSIHRVDAAGPRHRDGDAVRVFNDRGEIRAAARVTDDVAAGVVAVTRWVTGRIGSTAVSAVNALTSTSYADIGRAPTFSDTAVQVERIEA